MKSRHQELREQAQAFHNAHPEVWELFCRITRKLIRQGHKHYSAKAVFEILRWERSKLGGDGVTSFKVNNNFPSFYARRFMAINPAHEGFFRTREQVSKFKRATHLPELTPSNF